MLTKTEAELADSDQQALGIWRSKLADHTNSEAQHAEAHRMIDQILSKGVTGKIDNLAARIDDLAARIDRLEQFSNMPKPYNPAIKKSDGLKQKLDAVITTPPVPDLPSRPKTDQQKEAAERSDRVNKAIEEKKKRIVPDDAAPIEEPTEEKRQVKNPAGDPTAAKMKAVTKAVKKRATKKKPPAPPEMGIEGKDVAGNSDTVLHETTRYKTDDLPDWAKPDTNTEED